MNVDKTIINDCYIITMDRHEDQRGFFQETFVDVKWPVSSRWLQSNWSSSKQHTIRGIHISPYPKLITCVSGRILDVVIDLRKQSTTYLHKVYVWLDKDIPQQIFVPADCGHAFYAAENDSMITYLQGGRYVERKEHRIRYNDPTINIEWPAADYILSELDADAPFLKN